MRLAVHLAGVGCLVLASTPAAAQAPLPEPESSWSVGADYLLWWLRRGHLPPVVTTSSPASQGILGRPDTRIIYGEERLETRHEDRFNGLRFWLDWLAPCGLGIEARAFFLERDSTYRTIRHQTAPLLALAYTDAQTGQPASEVFAGPDPRRGLLWGGFVGYSRIELFGEEVNAVFPLLADEDTRIDLLAGARFLQLRDRYHHTATSRTQPDGAALFGVVDNFRIHNAFYGGQIGLRGERNFGRFFVQARGSAALGADDQLIRTFGQRVDHNPQRRIQTASGLFVQPSNSGRFERCQLDFVGEAAVNVGYQLGEHVRVFAGYTFLFWADPIRAAGQLDTVINTQQDTAPSPRRPGVPFQGDAFWAQGLNLGVEVRW
jgi:hypothetical protein